jgi:hypothetical protein
MAETRIQAKSVPKRNVLLPLDVSLFHYMQVDDTHIGFRILDEEVAATTA